MPPGGEGDLHLLRKTRLFGIARRHREGTHFGPEEVRCVEAALDGVRPVQGRSHQNRKGQAALLHPDASQIGEGEDRIVGMEFFQACTFEGGPLEVGRRCLVPVKSPSLRSARKAVMPSRLAFLKHMPGAVARVRLAKSSAACVPSGFGQIGLAQIGSGQDRARQVRTRQLASAQSSLASTLEERKGALESLSSGLVTRSEEIEQSLRSVENIVDNAFGKARERAGDSAKELSGSLSSSIEKIENLLSDTEIRSASTADMLKESIKEAVDDAISRFSGATDEIRQSANDIRDELTETRSRDQEGCVRSARGDTRKHIGHAQGGCRSDQGASGPVLHCATVFACTGTPRPRRARRRPPRNSRPPRTTTKRRPGRLLRPRKLPSCLLHPPPNIDLRRRPERISGW